MVQKTTFFRFQAVLASKLAPTWVPKTGPKPTQNLTNRLQISTSLQDAPKMAPNLEKHPKICKNLQKCYQHGRIMGPKFYQNPCQKRLQGEISWERLPGSASLGATWESLPGRHSLGEILSLEDLFKRWRSSRRLLGIYIYIYIYILCLKFMFCSV